MPDSAEPLTYCFDDFLLDKAAGVLLRREPSGSMARVPLGSRAFQLLSLLVERRGAIVTRQEIMDTVWPNLIVEDNNLSVQLSALRRALDLGRADGSCIRTLPGRGYRLLSPVTVSGRWQFEGSAISTGGNGLAASPADYGEDRPADEAVQPGHPLAPDAGDMAWGPWASRHWAWRQSGWSQWGSHRWRIITAFVCAVATLAVGLVWIAAQRPSRVPAVAAGPA